MKDPDFNDYYARLEQTTKDLKSLIEWTEQTHKMAQDALFYLDDRRDKNHEISESGVLTPVSLALLLEMFSTMPDLIVNLAAVIYGNDKSAAEKAWVDFGTAMQDWAADADKDQQG